MSLAAAAAERGAKASGSTPEIFPIVIYDLPDRDCDALASNGELSIANNGLSYYEHSYIDPIAQILTDYEHTNLRVVAVIEPDSLPNLVTNGATPTARRPTPAVLPQQDGRAGHFRAKTQWNQPLVKKGFAAAAATESFY